MEFEEPYWSPVLDKIRNISHRTLILRTICKEQNHSIPCLFFHSLRSLGRLCGPPTEVHLEMSHNNNLRKLTYNEGEGISSFQDKKTAKSLSSCAKQFFHCCLPENPGLRLQLHRSIFNALSSNILIWACPTVASVAIQSSLVTLQFSTLYIPPVGNDLLKKADVHWCCHYCLLVSCFPFWFLGTTWW